MLFPGIPGYRLASSSVMEMARVQGNFRIDGATAEQNQGIFSADVSFTVLFSLCRPDTEGASEH